MQGQKVVFECWSDGEADVVISYLATHGIEAVSNSEVPHTVMPLTVDGLGQVRVMVNAELVEMARGLLTARLAEVAELEQESGNDIE